MAGQNGSIVQIDYNNAFFDIFTSLAKLGLIMVYFYLCDRWVLLSANILVFRSTSIFINSITDNLIVKLFKKQWKGITR